jgi:hypothetical protein
MLLELWKNKSQILNNYKIILHENKRIIVSIILLSITLILYIYFQYNNYLDRLKIKSYITNHKDTFINYNINNSYVNVIDNAYNRSNGNKGGEGGEGILDGKGGNIGGNDMKIKASQFLKCNNEDVSNYIYTELLTYLDSNYLNKMNTINIIARGFTTKNDAITQYQLLCDDITPEEEIYINNQIRNYLRLEDKLLKGMYLDIYFKYWIPKIIIGKGKKWLENGMPHTHTNIIMMDAEWFTNIRMGTFIHEIGHIHQRLEPMEWDRLIIDWGFSRCNSNDNANKVVGLESLLIKNRLNPDGMDCYWKWTDGKEGHYWIGAIFRNDEPKTLGDVEYVAIKLEWNAENGLWYLTDNKTPLNRLDSFVAYFGLNHDHYHPNEIGSHYLEKLLQESIEGKTDVSNNIGYQKFRSWFISIYGSELNTNMSYKKRTQLRNEELKQSGAIKTIVNGKPIYQWNVLENYPWIKIDGESGSNYPIKSMEKLNGNGDEVIVRKRNYYDFGDITYIGNPL